MTVWSPSPRKNLKSKAMNEDKLRKANNLNNQISNVKRDIEDIDLILLDYESMGSSIEFRKNSNGWSRSFGSKKYGFREDLMRGVLDAMRERLVIELAELKAEFEKL